MTTVDNVAQISHMEITVTNLNLFQVNVKLEVFTAVTMKISVFWEVTPSGFYKNRRFRGKYRLLHQGDKNSCSVHRLLVTANVPSSPILVTLMMEAICSSETCRFLQEPHCATSHNTAFFLFQEQIKRPNSGNACYLLSSCLLPELEKS
jgi:hypothetical protein